MVQAAVAALALAVTLPLLHGCKDDLEDPTLGSVAIELSSPSAGAYENSTIYWGDSVLVANATDASYHFLLPAGPQSLRIENECARDFLPAAELQFDVRRGREQVVSWEVLPSPSVEVTSTILGAEIVVDGAATGRRTPATLCLSPGAHEISVRFEGASAGVDSVQRITIDEGSEQVSFDLQPLPQQKGALMELFTATLCPNCPVADEAATIVGEDLSLRARGALHLQVHTFWGGTDPFTTPTSLARDGFFDAEGDGIPAAFFNGGDIIRGAAGGVPILTQRYRQKLEAIVASPANTALFLRGVEHAPGEELRATLRVLLVADAATWGNDDPTKLELVAFYAKDRLEVFVQGKGDATFNNVVREYRRIGSLPELSLAQRGDYADLPISFSLASDTQWSEDRMTLGVFLQDVETKAIHQVVSVDLF